MSEREDMPGTFGVSEPAASAASAQGTAATKVTGAAEAPKVTGAATAPKVTGAAEAAETAKTIGESDTAGKGTGKSAPSTGRLPRTGARLNVLSVLLAVAIAALAVTGTFCLLLTPYPTHAFASMFVKDEISSASHDELVEVAELTLAYCNGDSSAELPVGDDYRTAYTEDVIGHLDDVTAFFTGMKVAASISAIVAVVLVLLVVSASRSRCAMSVGQTARRRRDGSGGDQPVLTFGSYRASHLAGTAIARSMIAGTVVVAALLAVIAVAAVIDFNSIFNLLHSLFFASGSWTFPYDSLLICALPEPYWMAMGVLWAVLLLVVLVLLVIFARIVRRRIRSARPSR